MALKEDLSGKITSSEQLVEILSKASHDWPSICSYRLDSTVAHTPWWAAREHLRLDYKVYDTSKVLEDINSLRPGLFVHVSKDDPNMVAYTPDATFGEADRQLKTSFGKFLRKHFPLFPDHAIEELTTKHKADLSCEVEFLSGMDIVDVYKSGSLQSCMTKDFERDTDLPHHPAEVYDAPGIRLAVLRDKVGKVNARSLVYEPSETDKRYIRVYGDQTLLRRLSRLGYTPGSFEGAKFKTLPVFEKGPSTYILPYIDAFNGPWGSRAGYVALIDGQLQQISRTYGQNIINNLRIPLREPVGTCGFAEFRSIKTSSFTVKDPILGKEINLLTDGAMDSVEYFYGGQAIRSRCTRGEYLEICNREALNSGGAEAVAVVRSRYSDAQYGERIVYALDTTPTFTHWGDRYIDTSSSREACGYARLSAKYYPELYADGQAPDWERLEKFVLVRSLDGEDSERHYIKKEDCFLLLTKPDGGLIQRTKYHKRELDKKRYVKVHRKSMNSPDTWAESSLVVQVSSGRKVVPDYHAVQKDFYTGLWEFERNLERVAVLNNVYYALSKSGRQFWEFERDAADCATAQMFDTWLSGGATLQGLQNFSAFGDPICNLRGRFRFSHLVEKDDLPYLEVLEAYTQSLEVAYSTGYRRFARRLRIYMAEMLAVEAPSPLPTTEAEPLQVDANLPETCSAEVV